MKLKMIVVLAVLFLATQVGAQTPTALKTPKEKLSYSIGVDIGNTIKRQQIETDPSVLAQGLKDAVSGSKLLLTDQEMREIMVAFQKDMVAKQTEMLKKVGETNKKEGDAFLAENKKKPGVVTLPDGLQYKVIKEGTGKMPKATDTVTVQYRGTLVNGSEFDSSFKRGEPATFQVSGVIPGWTEALQKMKTGSKWQLFVPPNLAYGERGAGNIIGPNSTLIFEVELVSIK
ncbi:MAG TPA: FKBP-type peptidyl-prolyl cis-trans isomerase [Syntrophorhabdaceae bacterium]|jgi:FKBP-type peptidyl-prolyl cis-trans isomerase FklB